MDYLYLNLVKFIAIYPGCLRVTKQPYTSPDVQRMDRIMKKWLVAVGVIVTRCCLDWCVVVQAAKLKSRLQEETKLANVN